MQQISRRALLMCLTLLPLSQVWAMSSFFYRPGIKKIQGELKVNGERVKEGMLVAWGDMVETGENSSAVFVLGKDAFLLRENTKVMLGVEAAGRFIRLQAGKLLSVFGPGEKTIETQAVLLGIRGTGCYLEVEPSGTYVCLCYGHVLLTPQAALDQTLAYQTSHHERPYWIEGVQIQAAEVRNHTDAELTMLEGLLGRLPPFHSSGKSYYN